MSITQRIDIGDGHALVLVTPDGLTEPTGAQVEHLTPAGALCMGWIMLDVPAVADFPADGKWQVEARDPLTLSPSLLCSSCGDHGFVRDGKWVRA
jgi:hypothetical protein